MRIDIDTALMTIAHVWQDRSTCSRNQVGAVIAKGGRHIGSGYNGAPAGMPHCVHPLPKFETAIEVQNGVNVSVPVIDPRKMYGEGCKISVHAEANAIAYCARLGAAIEGATLYTTLSPCYACAQLIIAAGLCRVVYTRPYRDHAGIILLDDAGVTVEKLI